MALSLCAAALSLAVSVPSASGQQPGTELEPKFTLTIGKRLAQSDARRVALSGEIGRVLSGDPASTQVTGGSVWLPQGLKLDFGRVPSCRRPSFDDPTVNGCPRGSIVGRPSFGTAFDAAAAEVDGFADADYVFVNGGPRRIWAFMTIYLPALVQEPVALDVRKPRSQKWSYRMDFRIPEILLVVAGVPISLSSFDIELDGIEEAPGYLALDRRCPRRGHFAFRSALTFRHSDGTVSETSRRARLRCRGLLG